jgi:hypothetical protein
VIAEGVETEAQRDQLLHFGCHEGQGYLFSRPVSPQDIARMVGNQGRSTLHTESQCERGVEPSEGGRISILGDRVRWIGPQDVVGDAGHSLEDAEVLQTKQCHRP